MTARCNVCPHRCTLAKGQVGVCGVRLGDGDRVVPHPQLGISTAAPMQVEHHPLYHFYPGSRTLAVGMVGCTAACAFCQNWDLALAPKHSSNMKWPHALSPDQLLSMAERHNSTAISFTYNEAVVWIEGVLELARFFKDRGFNTILVTNGFLTTHTISLLAPLIDGVKLDLKGPTSEFYRSVVHIPFSPVLEAIQSLIASGIWLELSTVMIPDLNDSENMVRCMIELIMKYCGESVPWHLQRFLPAYRLVDVRPGTLKDLRDIRTQALKEGLKYVYISDISNLSEQNTYCPSCGTILSTRSPMQWVPLPDYCPVCRCRISGRGLSPVSEK